MDKAYNPLDPEAVARSTRGLNEFIEKYGPDAGAMLIVLDCLRLACDHALEKWGEEAVDRLSSTTIRALEHLCGDKIDDEMFEICCERLFLGPGSGHSKEELH